MGLCRDDSNRYLRDLGYNVIRLPRDFLPPLSLLARQGGSTNYIGALDQLITLPAFPLPQVTSDQNTASINGKSTSSLKLSLGLSILDGLIAGLGGGKLGASADFTNARTLSLEFNNVLFDSVAPLSVSNYLRNGEIDAGSPLLQQYILGNGALFVVTERLKAAEITVSFENNKGVGAQVDVPVIANAVGGSLKVEASGGRSNAVSFKGAKRLAFGFKCFQIGVEDGELTMFSVEAGAVPVSLAGETASGALLSDGGLLEIGDGAPP